MTILVTGGTGLIGTALVNKLLSNGYSVIVYTRNPSRQKQAPNLRYAKWDIDRGELDPVALGEADHIIHLAGAGIADKRWSKWRKDEIRASRVKGGELLGKSLATIPNRVQSVISSSAIGWYGKDPVIPNPNPFSEEDSAAADFLGTTCRLWEESLQGVEATGKRVVYMRTGIVLSNDGGAFKEFARPLRFGIAAVLGNGRQMVSWIHIEDVVNLYIRAIEDERMRGVYNIVAPSPVSNEQLVLKIAEIRRKKTHIAVNVPAFALKIALGEMSIEVLKSTTVSCHKLLAAGFVFQYPNIHAAVEQLSA